tara:strand:- start:598 stop:1818 length:1221 start_codon:yes stop_codon:yes gene_type:complete
MSGSEVAFFSITASDKINLEEEETANNNRILLLLSTPKKLLATILIANNFINVAIVMVSTFVADNLINTNALSGTSQFIIHVVLITFIILLFGEVIPKVYATKYNVKFAKAMALPIHYMSIIFKPISQLLISSTSIIDKRVTKKTNAVSVDELEHALDLTKDSVETEEEKKILEGIVQFGNTDVKQIMTPRTDVIAIDYSNDFTTLLKEIKNSTFSRLPVYEDSIDNVNGILYIKDLIPYIEKKKNFKWNHLIRDPKFVPENKKLDDLLKEFQEEKKHIAIVVDEYGGTSGIVSLEDVLEEIVGDITDEFDEEDLVYSKLDDLNYVFEGKTTLIDMYRTMNIDGDEFEKMKGEADTIAGFCIEQAGKILLKNEKLSFDKYTFTVEAADKRRLKQVKVTINDQANEA